MGEIVIFPWNKNFELGFAKVDDQHKKIHNLINQLGVYLTENRKLINFDDIFLRLLEYAKEHFDTEEELWDNYFPKDDTWFLNHQSLHNLFFENIDSLIEETKGLSTNEAVKILLKFLIKWLVDHILNEDKKMGIVVDNIEKGKTLAEGKKISELGIGKETKMLVHAIIDMYEDIVIKTLELIKETKERERLEEELRISERHERIFSDAIMKSMPGMISLYDENAKLVRWNRQMEIETGFAPEELKDKYVLEWFREENHSLVEEKMKKMYADGYAEAEVDLITKKKGEVPYKVTGALTKIEGKDYFVSVGISIEDLKKAQVELEEALEGIIVAISKALELRDPYTAGHQRRVAEIAKAIAERMKLPKNSIDGIIMGGKIHDIGKLGIPIELLTKPSGLTNLEYKLIKTHVTLGIEALEGLKFPWPIAKIVGQHHERLNGTGYPKGLKDDEICIEARILAVADTFEAISAARPYRGALGIDRAMEEIRKHRGVLYDSVVVDILCELVKENKEKFLVDMDYN